ncbi:MAG TPA: ATP-binding protein [Jatrophihabitans sp.]|nr:ATP-binding protein [Jatrophihabitans sp.]
MAYREIGSALDRARAEILARYHDRLVQQGNPVAQQGSWEQARLQADSIITDVVETLNGVQIDFGKRAEMYSSEIGVSRAEGNIHQSASLQAAAVLFREILSMSSRAIEGMADPVGAMEMVALALNNSLNARVRDAAAAYSSFLLDKVHKAQIEERRRIARDLHDRIGSGISVAHRQLEFACLSRASNGEWSVGAIDDAMHTIKTVLADLRQLTSDLRLTEPLTSLETALLNYANGVGPPDAEIVVQVSGDESWATPTVRDETFLIIREAVRNAFKHNERTKVVIKVDIAPHELSARVHDDGIGFDLAETATGGGSGLATMTERALLLGGALEVASERGYGTAVRLVVPLGGELVGR